MVWEQRSTTLWIYHLRGSALVSGYVVRLPQEGPSGAVWDAILASTRAGQDQLIGEDVSLEIAQRTVEEQVAAQAHEP